MTEGRADGLSCSQVTLRPQGVMLCSGSPTALFQECSHLCSYVSRFLSHFKPGRILQKEPGEKWRSVPDLPSIREPSAARL